MHALDLVSNRRKSLRAFEICPIGQVDRAGRRAGGSEATHDDCSLVQPSPASLYLFYPPAPTARRVGLRREFGNPYHLSA
jgi:hypothetical protein